MPRTRRYIFNTLTVVSLLLLLGTVGLWVRSFSNSDTISKGKWTEADQTIKVAGFCSAVGGIHAFIDSYTGIDVKDYKIKQIPFGYHVHENPENQLDLWTNSVSDWAGFGRYEGSIMIINNNTMRQILNIDAKGVVIPHWFLTLIFATLPAIWLFKWNKRRKRGPNACPGCGYDLTGNESGECPECGQIIAGKQNA